MSERIEPGAAAPRLRVGVVGHRENRLRPGDIPALTEKIASILERLGSELGGHLSVTSSLAEGTDRIGARAARAAGLPLECPLPFAREEYEKDFARPESRTEYRDLLDTADRVWELDGSRQDVRRAYAAVGDEVLENSDMLVTIWDGEEARGRGGTADLVGAAIARMPVVWIHPDPAVAIRLITAVKGGRPQWVSLSELEAEVRRLFGSGGTQAKA